MGILNAGQVVRAGLDFTIEEEITLEELIRRTVHEEIRAVAAEDQSSNETRWRGFLTQAEVDARAARGKVSLKGHTRMDMVKEIDAGAEVQRAIRAFTTGAFLVLAGERQVEDLQHKLTFKEQTQVTFLRIMPLAGG
jgi:predicted transcriptional regulator